MSSAICLTCTLWQAMVLPVGTRRLRQWHRLTERLRRKEVVDFKPDLDTQASFIKQHRREVPRGGAEHKAGLSIKTETDTHCVHTGEENKAELQEVSLETDLEGSPRC